MQEQTKYPHGFSIEQDTDRYGKKIIVVTRNGERLHGAMEYDLISFKSMKSAENYISRESAKIDAYNAVSPDEHARRKAEQEAAEAEREAQRQSAFVAALHRKQEARELRIARYQAWLRGEYQYPSKKDEEDDLYEENMPLPRVKVNDGVDNMDAVGE